MSTRRIKNYLHQLGIPESYGRSPELALYSEPAELVEAGPNIIGRMQRLAPSAAKAWAGLQAAAAADSIELLIVSGFRSIDDQAKLIFNKLEAGQAIEDILKVNTAPGYSQHHTGRAIDIATPGVRPLTEPFDQSPAFLWLDAHAESFGFRMPYGYNNEWGLNYEPWHWFLSEERDQ